MAAALKASPTAPKSQGQKELSGKKSKETSELVHFQLQQDCCLSKQIAPKQRTNTVKWGREYFPVTSLTQPKPNELPYIGLFSQSA